MDELVILFVGAGAGLLYGLFGAGGSAFATPVLALVGVPGVIAVAAPLPAMLPSAAAGVGRHLRGGTVDRRITRLALAGGVPGAVVGGLLSDRVDGHLLVTLSAAFLLVVGGRVLLPDPPGHVERCATRRDRTGLVVGAAAAVGVLTGLLANGGGFLLVPLFVVGFGLSTRMAATTSLVVAAALSVPTLAVHWWLGHLDWAVALAFAAGCVPATTLGRAAAERLPADHLRRAFGVLLVAFAAWFLLR